MARSGALKNGMKATDSTATVPQVSGRKRPTPQAGDHFCTSTSKSAKLAAASAADNTVRPTAWRGRDSPRLRRMIASVLRTAAIHHLSGMGSGRSMALPRATRMIFRPMTGVPTETSP